MELSFGLSKSAYSGSTENAGPELGGPNKREGKMYGWKMDDQF